MSKKTKAKAKPAAKKPAAKAPAAKPVVKRAAAVAVAAVAVLGAGTVLAELATAGKSEAPKKGEQLEAYATRVLNDVANLSDDEFGKLSKPAQDWYNAAASALNEEPPAALPAPTAVKVGTTGKPTPATKAVTPAANKAKVPTAKAAKTKPAAAAKADSKPRGEGVAHKVRSAVVANPEITFEAAAKKAGVGDAKVGGHAWNIFNEAKRVMELVTAAA